MVSGARTENCIRTDLLSILPSGAIRRREHSRRRIFHWSILISKARHLDHRNHFGRTALFVAVRTGNRNDVLALLAAGADLEIEDDQGRTPASCLEHFGGDRLYEVASVE